MSNLYTTTARILELLPQVCAKYGLEFEVEFYFVLSPEGKKIAKWEIVKDITIQNKQDYIPAIEEPQIRQILVGLFGVWEATQKNHQAKAENPSFKNRAEELERRWLCFRTDLVDSTYITYPPLFDREPETVLTELITILENLLK